MEDAKGLYSRFIKGDEEAFKEIISMYRYNLMFYINNIVHNITDAEDLMEDTFAELVLNKGKFKGNSELKTYLYVIARNKAINYLKKNSRVSFIPISEAENLIDIKSVFEDNILKEESKRNLHNALLKLPSQYQEILRLLYFEDMSTDETATVMKKSKRQITNLTYQAKKALRAILEEEGL